MIRIELEKRDAGWFVRCGDLWEDRLTSDEALGTVASIMYSGKPGYLKSGLQHAIWNAKYGYALQPLLTEGV